MRLSAIKLLALAASVSLAMLWIPNLPAVAQTARDSVDKDAPWPTHVQRGKDGRPVAQRETGHPVVPGTIYYRITLCAGASWQWTPPGADLERAGLKGPQASAGNFRSTGDKVKGVNAGTGGKAKFEGKATLNKTTNQMGRTDETVTYDITDNNKNVAHIVLKVHILPCDDRAERGYNQPRLATVSDTPPARAKHATDASRRVPPATKQPPMTKQPPATKQPPTFRREDPTQGG
jgi:hypothetical protein